MTDEQAAEKYTLEECDIEDSHGGLLKAFRAGAAYKEEQTRDKRIAELASLYKAKSGQDIRFLETRAGEIKKVVQAERERIAPLEARLAWAKGRLRRAKEHMSLAGPSHSEDEHEWLASYAAGPTEEGEK